MRIFLLLLLALAGCSRNPTTHGPLPHEVYVWQRKWTPAVRSGVERAAPVVDAFDVLIGEIGFQEGAVRTVRAQVDYNMLAKAGKPVALGLRIGTYTGEFSSRSQPLREANDVLQAALSQASAAGVRVRELQIDFDCPSARLAGYAVWIRELHATFPGTPLTITALPDWLGRRDFAPLAQSAGRYVLQVHSVPGAAGAVPILCDLAAARQAVGRAGRLGVPFRVALPTYSCVLSTDAAGHVTAIHAEDSPPEQAARQIVVRSDAAELTALVREWEHRRPASLRGVVWYRLPIDTDQLNWRWETLAAIIAGKTPQPQGALVFTPSGSGVEDTVLENRGDADWPLPTVLALPRDVITADGVNGFRLESDPPGPWILHGVKGRILPPGGRLVCGWVRRDASLASTPPTP